MSLLQFIFIALFFLLAGSIALQDLKHRLVSLWLLILYSLNCIAFIYFIDGLYTLLSNVLFALIYFGFMFGILFLFYFLKEKKISNILNSKIGLADIIVLLAIGFTLSTIHLVLFFSISLTLSVFLALFWFNKKNQSIPLAAIVCICHFLYLIVFL